MRHPKVLSRINPNFYEDMQKVFYTERSPEDSERYVYKLKKCEDPLIKSPTSESSVKAELDYELFKMRQMKHFLKARQYSRSITSKFKK